MNRRQLLAGLAAGVLQPGAIRAATRKNVLLIMSDQHRKDCLGVAGDPVARTPNLDALARSGVRFSNAYCSNPVCTPSRASLLTGLYTHNHQAFSNAVPWPIEHKTMAHYFGQAGYVTGLVGKMHFVDAQTHGFDYRLDFNDWYQYLGPKTRLYANELSRANSGSGLPQIDDLWRDYGDPWKNDRELDDREGPVHTGRVSKIPERDHFESFVARESIRFLQRFSGRQPFFLVCSFLKPHDPFMPAERFAQMFSPADMHLPESWGKVDLKTAPDEVRNSIVRNAPTPELRSRNEALKRIAYYYANLAQMDDCAGAVLRELTRLGLADDTIVMYTSDHGEMLGAHSLWQKFQFYEESCGVPLIIRAPGVTKAGVCETPVTQVSVLPTLARLCDIPIQAKLDEDDFVQQLQDPAVPRNKPVYSEYDLRTPRAKYMIRDGDFKYTYRTHDRCELFNLRTDPKEMNNLTLDASNRDLEERLRTKLFAWYTPPERTRQQ